MAVQHGIWKIGEKPQPLAAIRLDSEALLEEQITRDISILNSGWMLIGRSMTRLVKRDTNSPCFHSK